MMTGKQAATGLRKNRRAEDSIAEQLPFIAAELRAQRDLIARQNDIIARQQLAIDMLTRAANGQF